MVKLKWGMEYKGYLVSVDGYMNLQVKFLWKMLYPSDELTQMLQKWSKMHVEARFFVFHWFWDYLAEAYDHVHNKALFIGVTS